MAAFEKHFSAKELAKLWHVSDVTIRRLFRDEPGVIVLGASERRFKRQRLVNKDSDLILFVEPSYILLVCANLQAFMRFGFDSLKALSKSSSSLLADFWLLGIEIVHHRKPAENSKAAEDNVDKQRNSYLGPAFLRRMIQAMRSLS